MWLNHSWFNHSPVDGHLGGFWLLAIIKKAAVNIHVQVCVWTCTILGG